MRTRQCVLLKTNVSSLRVIVIGSFGRVDQFDFSVFGDARRTEAMRHLVDRAEVFELRHDVRDAVHANDGLEPMLARLAEVLERFEARVIDRIDADQPDAPANRRREAAA